MLTFLANKQQTPGKCILEVGQPVWVWHAIELPDIESIRLIFKDRPLVVHVKIIWSREDCHHRWETSRASLPVHAVPAYTLSHDLHIGEYEDLPRILHLMGANDGQ